MTFEDWMIHRGLTLSSAKKYDGAIRGVMSEWAISTGLMAGPLISLVSRSAFEPIASAIRALPVYQDRNKRGHSMYNSALVQFHRYLTDGSGNDVEADIATILGASDIGPTEKSNLVMSRIGQGTFRQKLVAFWNGCAVTGFKDTNLLVASHIKPWRTSTNAERLDPFNGLLLVPNLDKAFDAGYVTFDTAGQIQCSPLLTEPDKLGISSGMRVALSSQHEAFMAFHRTVVFRTD
jgi:putative restriction endonuclease